MGIETRYFLGTLKHVITTGATNLSTGTGTDTGGQCYVAPWNTKYTGICPLSAFAVYFARFKIVSAYVEFCSTQPTSENRQITMATVDDPCYWESVNIGGANNTPTKAQMNNMAGSITFPAWTPNKRFKLNLQKKMLFTAGDVGAADFDFADEPANLRLMYAGTWAVRLDGTIPAATESIGDMFMHIRVDFCNIVSQITTSIDPALSVRERKSNTRRLKEVEEKLAALIIPPNETKIDEGPWSQYCGGCGVTQYTYKTKMDFLELCPQHGTPLDPEGNEIVREDKSWTSEEQTAMYRALPLSPKHPMTKNQCKLGSTASSPVTQLSSGVTTPVKLGGIVFNTLRERQ